MSNPARNPQRPKLQWWLIFMARNVSSTFMILDAVILSITNIKRMHRTKMLATETYSLSKGHFIPVLSDSLKVVN